jgi:threonine/homoserine/homoserine lactone efflux protein
MREIAAFLGIAALVIATPGQDTALTIRNTLLGGRTGGVFTALGVSSGQATWTVATSVGVGALLVASEPAFVALKLAGAAYLVFLGAQALWRAVTGAVGEAFAGSRPARRVSAVAALRQGLISNLGNPKMLAFFTSLLPQFADSVVELLAFGFVFCSLTLIWLTGYAFAVARAGELVRRTRVRRAIEALTGTVLVALGLRLASERH